MSAKPLTTGEKVQRLLVLLGLHEIMAQVTDHGPYALLPAFRRLIIIYDQVTPEDQLQISRQIDELAKKPEFKDLRVDTYKPLEFMALVSTNGLYAGFHDQMGFAIYLWALTCRPILGLFGEPIPNYAKIERLLAEAGFVNIKESRPL